MKKLLILAMMGVVAAGCNSSPDVGDAEKPPPAGATMPAAPQSPGGAPSPSGTVDAN